MKIEFYHFLQWLQLISLLLPIVLIYVTKTQHHLLWLFAGYFMVHLILEMVIFFGDAAHFSASTLKQVNTTINIINMFDGVGCMVIVHYAAARGRFKNAAGVASLLLFAAELLYALIVGVDATARSASYPVGASLLVTFIFLLGWLYEHYKRPFYNRQQKALLYLSIAMIINYGASFCPYVFIYLLDPRQSTYIEQHIIVMIPNIVYLVIASIGIWMYSTKPEQQLLHWGS
ncbi:MAG TPA: hypothetical protein VL307_10340 [Chitinophagaceae bacterium]|nr:hypothetical protein [Chitinophagaceae bacterium]